MSIDSNHLLNPDGLSYLLTQLKSKFSRATNLVNGNATGSVRNSYSNSQYTMGNTATALGYQSKSSGPYSFSEGEYTVASGQDAHAEGSNTTASGLYSHSQGSGTIASGFAQTALGQFNVSDSDSTYAVIIGNGLQDTSRSNALTVDWNGNVYIQGIVQTSASEALYQSTPAYPSSAQSHSFWMYDSSGTKTEEHRIAGYQAYIGTTGNVYSSLYAYKSDGSADKACIEAVYKNSDGTKYIAANCDVNVTGGISATGNASINGTLTTGSFIYAGGTANQATNHVEIGTNGIEIYHSTPFIDFHFGNSTADHTSRIIERSSGTLSVTSALSVESTLSVGSTLKTNGAIYTGAKTTSTAGAGCYIGTDGTMALQNITTDSNAYGAANPHITFLNTNASQNIQLIFTDFDSVQAPASLTLAGNQGGEFFIVPQFKVTQNIHGEGKCAFRLNTDNWLRINDLGNYSSGVYFGTSIVRTDGMYIQCGQGSSTSCSWLENTGKVFARQASGEAQIQADNNSNNKIYLYANSDGRTGIYGYSANGTAMSFISRANNSSTLVINGGLQVNTTNAIISTTAGTGVYFKVKNSHHEGSLYVSDSSTGNFGLYSNTLGKWVIYTQNTNGNLYLPTIAPSHNVTGGYGNMFIQTSGKVGVAAGSSRRYKHDIRPLLDYKKVLDIPVVSFKYNEGYLMEGDCYEGLDVPGLIAEEVEQFYPICTLYDDTGRIESWNIRHVVPPMLAVEQEHEKRINELEAKVEQLSQENEQLKQRIETIA